MRYWWHSGRSHASCTRTSRQQDRTSWPSRVESPAAGVPCERENLQGCAVSAGRSCLTPARSVAGSSPAGTRLGGSCPRPRTLAELRRSTMTPLLDGQRATRNSRCWARVGDPARSVGRPVVRQLGGSGTSSEFCSASEVRVSRQAALMRPTWENACGKLPVRRPVPGSTSSDSSPRSLACSTA